MKRHACSRAVARIVSVAQIALLVSISLPLFAWQGEQESASVLGKPGYPVVVDGYVLFYVYEGLGAVSAEERAERISAGLEKLTRAEDLDPKKFTVNDEDGTTTVRYGDQLIVTITDAEAHNSGLPRKALASQYVRILEEKLPLARELHTPRYLWNAVAYTAVTTLLYVGVVWLVVIIGRWLLRLIETTPKGRLKGIKIQDSEIVKGERLTALLASIVRVVRMAILAILTFVMLTKAFSYFPYTRGQSNRLLGYVTSPLVAVGQGILAYLPKAIYIIVILVAMYYVMRIVRIIAREVERGRIRFPGFYPEWVQPTYKIVRVLLYAFAAVLIYPYLPGESSPAFKGISVFLGLLFSLGSTSAVANFVAGVILIYTRGFRVGDWVTIGENTGEVVQMSMLATHLRTIRNEEVTVPNSVVLGSFVTNFSLQAQEKGVVLHTSVTIGYDAPWRTIHKLLIDAALKTKHILQDPPPFVLQANLQDSYVQYEINAYTDHPLQMPFIYSDLHANIQDSFFEAGVEIMSPVFYSLRDGNRAAIPDSYLSKGYRAPAFRIHKADPLPESDGGSDS
ncbi:MAG TPA: mechanosensitive ion channel family protein [Terriglobales bacterium]|nr:mechanosensitive ion channel family protein [Terriglobales bacterium]